MLTGHQHSNNKDKDSQVPNGHDLSHHLTTDSQGDGTSNPSGPNLKRGHNKTQLMESEELDLAPGTQSP